MTYSTAGNYTKVFKLSLVPDVMIVVGPNGAGKSTLLYELWRLRNSIAEPGTRVTYITRTALGGVQRSRDHHSLGSK